MKGKYFVILVMIVVASITAGIFLQQYVGSANSSEQVINDYPLELSMSGMHMHDTKDVQPSEAPTVDITVMEDTMKQRQYMVYINTTNFRFAPENASEEAVRGQGHAHVYIDDVMLSRATGPWYHIPKLKPGNHTVKVTLNHNSHEEYAVNGVSITDSETIIVG